MSELFSWQIRNHRPQGDSLNVRKITGLSSGAEKYKKQLCVMYVNQPLRHWPRWDTEEKEHHCRLHLTCCAVVVQYFDEESPDILPSVGTELRTTLLSSQVTRERKNMLSPPECSPLHDKPLSFSSPGPSQEQKVMVGVTRKKAWAGHMFSSLTTEM